jgi:hypothetical protein
MASTTPASIAISGLIAAAPRLAEYANLAHADRCQRAHQQAAATAFSNSGSGVATTLTTPSQALEALANMPSLINVQLTLQQTIVESLLHSLINTHKEMMSLRVECEQNRKVHEQSNAALVARIQQLETKVEKLEQATAAKSAPSAAVAAAAPAASDDTAGTGFSSSIGYIGPLSPLASGFDFNLDLDVDFHPSSSSVAHSVPTMSFGAGASGTGIEKAGETQVQLFSMPTIQQPPSGASKQPMLPVKAVKPSKPPRLAIKPPPKLTAQAAQQPDKLQHLGTVTRAALRAISSMSDLPPMAGAHANGE